MIKEVMTGDSKESNKWELCLQWCLYVYDNGTSEHGYRFIWRRPGGNLVPARGQTRIPSLQYVKELVNKAKKEGWDNLNSDDL